MSIISKVLELLEHRGAASGYASLDASSVVEQQPPAIAASKVTSGRFPVDRLPALTTDKIWKGTGANPTEVDVPAGPTIVRKTADETVNNSTALQDDNHLLLALGANEVWLVHLFMLVSGHWDAHIKFGWGRPSGCAIYWGPMGDTLAPCYWNHTWTTSKSDLLKEDETLSTHVAIAPDMGIGGHLLCAIVANGANAGNLTLRWAQAVAISGNTTVKMNSCLIAHKLA